MSGFDPGLRCCFFLMEILSITGQTLKMAVGPFTEGKSLGVAIIRRRCTFQNKYTKWFSLNKHFPSPELVESKKRRFII